MFYLSVLNVLFNFIFNWRSWDFEQNITNPWIIILFLSHGFVIIINSSSEKKNLFLGVFQLCYVKKSSGRLTRFTCRKKNKQIIISRTGERERLQVRKKQFFLSVRLPPHDEWSSTSMTSFI